MQADPVGLAGGLNRYEYASNGPLAQVDPLGLSPTAAAAGTLSLFGLPPIVAAGFVDPTAWMRLFRKPTKKLCEMLRRIVEKERSLGGAEKMADWLLKYDGISPETAHVPGEKERQNVDGVDVGYVETAYAGTMQGGVGYGRAGNVFYSFWTGLVTGGGWKEFTQDVGGAELGSRIARDYGSFERFYQEKCNCE